MRTKMTETMKMVKIQFSKMQKKMQESVKTRARKAEMVSEESEMKQRCEICNGVAMWSEINYFNESMIR